MQIKQFLSQAFYLNQRIETSNEELERLRSLSTSVQTPDLSCDRVQTSGAGDKIGDIVARIVDLEAVIQSYITRMIKAESQIYALINEIDDNKLKLILQKRYLLFQRWEQICEDLNICDLRYTFRLHRKALDEAAKKKSGLP